MPSKPPESMQERIDRLRKNPDSKAYVKALYNDLAVLVGEMFNVEERIDAKVNEYDVPDSLMLTEFMVVCGFQFIDDNGSRGGDVRLIVQDGSMPAWAAEGIISRATVRIRQQLVDGEFADDEDTDADGR